MITDVVLLCQTCGAVFWQGDYGQHLDTTGHGTCDVWVPTSVTCATCEVDLDATDVILHSAERGHDRFAVRMSDGSLREIAG